MYDDNDKRVTAAFSWKVLSHIFVTCLIVVNPVLQFSHCRLHYLYENYESRVVLKTASSCNFAKF